MSVASQAGSDTGYLLLGHEFSFEVQIAEPKGLVGLFGFTWRKGADVSTQWANVAQVATVDAGLLLRKTIQ